MQKLSENNEDNELNQLGEKTRMVVVPPYFMIDKDYRIIFANEAYEHRAEAEPGSLQGRYFYNIVPEHTFQEIKESLMEAKPDKPVILVHPMSRTRQKRDAWIIITMFLDGEVSCRHIIGFSNDLLNINDSASLFQQLIEKLPISIYTMSKDRYKYVNPQHCITYGYSAEELRNKEFMDLVDPKMYSKTVERMKALWNKEPVEPSYEIETVKKNGEKIILQIFHILMEYDQGQFILAAGIDNTARKKAEDELIQIKKDLEKRVESRTSELEQANQSLKKLYTEVEGIYQSISDGIMVLQKKLGVVMINNALRQILGKNFKTFQRHIESILKLKSNMYFEQLLHGENFQNIEMNFDLLNLRFFVSGSVVEVGQGTADRFVLVFKPAEAVQNLVNRLSGARARIEFDDIITMNDQMLNIVHQAQMAAGKTSTILIQGESGTGKEMFAQAIHNYSARRNGPFVAINCGVIPRDLMGSELFGYEGGSFTGAKAGGNPGKFEFASGGTLFLDEIGDMPLEQQVALLRVLQEKNVMRIGSNTVIPVDVRIICATNKDLEQEVISGNFRSDLYYRINVINLNIPSLREHPEDISVLFDSFLKRISRSNITDRAFEVEERAYVCLKHYPWPGNVRELQNVAERTANSCINMKISERDLPLNVRGIHGNSFNEKIESRQEFQRLHNDSNANYIKEVLEKEEKKELFNMMVKYRGNITRVAKELGVARSTIYRKIKQYGMNKEFGN